MHTINKAKECRLGDLIALGIIRDLNVISMKFRTNLKPVSANNSVLIFSPF